MTQKASINNDFRILPLPEHGSCLVCGSENEKSMGLSWRARMPTDWQERDGPLAPGEVIIFSEFEFDEAQQGPPGHAHGGACAAVLDEAMGAAVWQSGLRGLAANISIDFRAPTPLRVPLRAEAWVARVEGRKAYTAGRLLAGDRVLVEATGLFVHIPDFFGDHIQFPAPQPQTVE